MSACLEFGDDTPQRPFPWWGGRNYSLDHNGEYVNAPGWRFGRELLPRTASVQWDAPQPARPQVELRAFPYRDRGRGRREYSWTLMGSWSWRVNLEIGRGSARSLRGMLDTADAVIGDGEQVTQRLWALVVQPHRCAEVFLMNGEPFCTSLEIDDGWQLPYGTYVKVRHDLGKLHATTVYRQLWSLSGVGAALPAGLWLPSEVPLDPVSA